MSATYLEIERKFLVTAAWPTPERTRGIRQMYLNPGTPISTRLRESDGSYTLTLKAGISATTRREFDMPVDAPMGREMMAIFATPALIEKQRHEVRHGGMLWEVDVFAGQNTGLIVAEIELPSADAPFARPDWIGRDVTHDPRFTNHALSLHPFARWGVAYEEL
jgi:adenylate cyclase